MKLTKKFLLLMRKNSVSMLWIAKELEIGILDLIESLNGNYALDYEQSRQLVAMFGAEAMARVIDWEGMNVRCPI